MGWQGASEGSVHEAPIRDRFASRAEPMSRFDALIGPHIPHLRRYARALTGDVTRADDLVHDTLQRAWATFHLWRPAPDVRPWLFSIMHTVFVSQARASIPPGRAADQEAQASAPPDRTGMLEMNHLLACLDRLPSEQREVLLLVALERLDYTQVGKILGLPVDTVTSQLARARTRLRALLEGGTDERELKVIR